MVENYYGMCPLHNGPCPRHLFARRIWLAGCLFMIRHATIPRQVLSTIGFFLTLSALACAVVNGYGVVHDKIQKVLAAYPAAINHNNVDGDLPVHLALREGTKSKETIDALITLPHRWHAERHTDVQMSRFDDGVEFKEDLSFENPVRSQPPGCVCVWVGGATGWCTCLCSHTNRSMLSHPVLVCRCFGRSRVKRWTRVRR